MTWHMQITSMKRGPDSYLPAQLLRNTIEFPSQVDLTMVDNDSDARVFVSSENVQGSRNGKLCHTAR